MTTSLQIRPACLDTRQDSKASPLVEAEHLEEVACYAQESGTATGAAVAAAHRAAANCLRGELCSECKALLERRDAARRKPKPVRNAAGRVGAASWCRSAGVKVPALLVSDSWSGPYLVTRLDGAYAHVVKDNRARRRMERFPGDVRLASHDPHPGIRAEVAV